MVFQDSLSVCLPAYLCHLVPRENGEMRVVAEGQVSVVHDGAEIVSNSARIRVLLDFEVQLNSRPRIRVLAQNFQGIVAIAARLERIWI